MSLFVQMTFKSVHIESFYVANFPITLIIQISLSNMSSDDVNLSSYIIMILSKIDNVHWSIFRQIIWYCLDENDEFFLRPPNI